MVQLADVLLRSWSEKAAACPGIRGSAFYNWAPQFKQDAKVRKKSAALVITQPPTTQHQSLPRRSWEACQRWYPQIIVGLIVMILGTIITRGLGLDSHNTTAGPSAPSLSPPPITQGWDYKLNRAAPNGSL